MVCFLTFGAYTMIKPYADDNDQTFAVLAQVCIFFSLLSTVALDTANPTGAVAKTMDVLLMLLFSLPVALEVWLYTRSHQPCALHSPTLKP